MKRVQQGFTLIELMIVVAIIGILAAIAIPQYQDYITRAKWQDNVAQVAAFKTAIAECVQNNAGDLTLCDTQAEVVAATGAVFPTATKDLASVTYPAGALILVGTANVKGCTVTITPTVSATSVTWGFATTGAGCGKAQTGF